MTKSDEERVLHIRVKYEDAIYGIMRYKEKIDDLKSAEKDLAKQVKEGTVTAEEYRTQVVAMEEQVKEYKENVRGLSKEIQNNIKQEKEQEGSLRSLRAELSNATKQYDSLSRSERNGAKGEELRNHINDITDELKKAEEETTRFYRNVGNYNGAVTPLRTELKELTMQLAEMERNGLRGSEAYNELAKKAGALADHIADARAEIQHYASDTRLLDNTVNIVTTASTAWQTYQGAVQAFGIESKEAMEAMSKLQGIIAMTNGVQALAKTFTDNSTASYKLLHGMLRLVGLEKNAETVATEANTVVQNQNAAATVGVTAANQAEAAALETTTGAMTATTVAGKVLRTVLMTLGIGLVVAALGMLVSLAGDVIKFFTSTSEEAKRAAEIQSALNAALDEGNKAYAKASAEIDGYRSRLEGFNGTKEQEEKLVNELNKKYGEAMGYYKSVAQWKEVLAKNGEAYCKMLLKEAEAQALLNKYTEAFISLQEIQRKDASEYGSWYTTKAGDNERKEAAVRQAQQDAQFYMDEYKKKMQEASDIKMDWNFGDHTSPSSKSSGKDDSAKDAADAAKKEREEIRKAEDLLTQLIKNNVEQRRKNINDSYNRQIEDLKLRLEKEKNLTIEAKKAIQSQITSLELKRDEELSSLSQKKIEDDIRREEEYLKRRLAVVRQGSEEEFRLKATHIENQRQLALSAAEQENVSEEEKQRNLWAINEEYNHMYDELLNERTRRELEEIEKRYEQKILQAEVENGPDGELEVLRLRMEEKQAMLEAAQQMEGETIEEFNMRKLQMEKDFQKAKKALADGEVKVETGKAKAIASVYGGLSKVVGAFADENEELAKLSKVLALGEIAINTGTAIAKGVSQAQSVPYPANLAAIATTVATVLSNIATAISTVKSAKFATGGAVEGEGTETSDSIPAMLSNGESVLTAAATRMFAPALSAFNQMGGGVPITVQNNGTQMGEEFLANAVAKGMSMAPRPVVSVEEIRDVESRLDVIEDLSTI